MAKTIHTVQAAIALALFFVLPGPTYTDRDAQKIARAREALKRARAELDRSREALEQTYTELEKQFERISGSYAVQFITRLEEQWYALLPRLEARFQNAKGEGKPLSRRAFEDYAGPLLEAAAKKLVPLDQRLLDPFLDKGMEVIYGKLRKREPFEEGDIQVKLLDLLGTETRFHEFWNQHLYTRVPEALAFAEANTRFAEKLGELDRLEHPEDYTKRGGRAPPRMAYVPAGSYVVGKNSGLEQPRRRVTLKAFYIDKYEITNKEYRDFLNSLDPRLYEDYVPFFWPLNRNMEHVYPKDRADRPVAGVSWKAAWAYAKWAEKRLPTEEEWEVAARGKERFAYPWGNDFDASKCNTSGKETTEVGRYPEGVSPFGCHDMAGNVWEWTSTTQEGKVLREPDGTVRNMVIRGGDYRSGANQVRTDFRWVQPMDPYAGRNPSKKVIGFRCAKDVE